MRQLLGNNNRSARQSGKFENRQHANQRWLAIFAWSAIHPYHCFVVFPGFQLVNERLATTGQVRAAIARNGRAPGCNLEWQIRPDAILGHDLFVSPFPHPNCRDVLDKTGPNSFRYANARRLQGILRIVDARRTVLSETSGFSHLMPGSRSTTADDAISIHIGVRDNANTRHAL
ncbi:hypothetical protein SAMN03159382_00333 [Pseudomonas sp. NFACC23-1]|nr:hypothetical protein SAMN03159386_00017 [Pseudomonas sp. NFACC17-2]SEI85731.1 hypothetical protein SAMN03159382_00333 [Pseudomonas sp. NFACC23-1]SFW24425.1 hypothetical protein SAMN05660640_00611 [Pseudomonas sp. NFACC16-2]